MADYRIFFLSKTGHFDTSETLTASRDVEAVTMGELLYDAVSEVYRGYELWLAGRLVAIRRKAGVPQPISAITARMQASLLEREEFLRDSRLALKRSRRLLAQIEELRGSLRSAEGPAPASRIASSRQ